jgi:hypothetical protein
MIIQDVTFMPSSYLFVEERDRCPIIDPPCDGAKREVQCEQEGMRTARKFGLRNVTSNLEPE